MKKNPCSQSGLFNPRAFAAFTLCSAGVLLAAASFAAPKPRPAALTFGHPVISGIGGVGFEQGLRIDPSNPNRLYTSVPGSLSSNTSWIWHSLDGGKTFKWVVDATALEGKATTCFGGGDTETGVDSAGHLYFADLTLANFSTSRSDDNGATWSPGGRVNNDSTVNSQFLPKIALDQTTGNIATVWYDARNDLGTGGSGDTDVLPNTDAQFWGSFSTNGGVSFGPNIRISAGTSNSHDSGNGIDYGDYSGLAFYGGVAHPAWSDNSNSTGTNPDGSLHQLDIYTAAVRP